MFGLLLYVPTFLAARLARAFVDGRSLVATAAESPAGFVDLVELLYYGTPVSVILRFVRHRERELVDRQETDGDMSVLEAAKA